MKLEDFAERKMILNLEEMQKDRELLEKLFDIATCHKLTDKLGDIILEEKPPRVTPHYGDWRLFEIFLYIELKYTYHEVEYTDSARLYIDIDGNFRSSVPIRVGAYPKNMILFFKALTECKYWIVAPVKIEISCTINGESASLAELSEETLLRMRKLQKY